MWINFSTKKLYFLVIDIVFFYWDNLGTKEEIGYGNSIGKRHV